MKLKGKKLVMFIFGIALFSGVIAYASGNFAKYVHTETITELPKQEVANIMSLRDSIKKQLIDEVLIPIKYNLMVTPKEIDFQIEKLSLLIANSLNKSLHDNFNPTK